MVIWLVVAVLAAIGEMLTTGFFLASVAVAAVLTALLALLIPLVIVQVVVFAVLSLAGIVLLRPLVVRGLGIDSHISLSDRASQSHLIGRRAVATQLLDAAGGQIRIGVGEFWTARPYNPSEVIPAGTPVEILLIDGLTALVEPVEPPDSSAAASPPVEASTEKGTNE